MTGPEHFSEAEALIQQARTAEHYDTTAIGLALAEAQVHATLALAAATALSAPVNDEHPGFTVEEWDAWFAAAGTRPGGGR